MDDSHSDHFLSGQPNVEEWALMRQFYGKNEQQLDTDDTGYISKDYYRAIITLMVRDPVGSEDFEDLIKKLKDFVPSHDFEKTHTKMEHNFCPHFKTDFFSLENAENVANFSMHDEL